MVTTPRYTTSYDLTNCDAEPLRFIRSCQDQAVLLVLYADSLRIKAVSVNAAEHFGRELGDLIGADAGAVLSGEVMGTLRNLPAGGDLGSLNPLELLTEQRGVVRRENLLVHRSVDCLLLEVEPRSKDFGTTASLLRIDQAMARIQGSVVAGDDVFAVVVQEVRAITGYDRVYLYRFDEDYNGQIIAEDKRAEVGSLLHLRYPHTDIPQQARELYLSQQIRQVASSRLDSDSLVVSDDGAAIDLGKANSRGVSPIHLEYLRNMGVGASMSIGVVVNDRLWGLIACHHHEDRFVDCRLRQLLGFFGRILSGHLALQQSTAYQNSVLSSNLTRAGLVEKMSESNDLLSPLVDQQSALLNLVGARGSALILGERIVCLGDCPTEEQVRQLFAFVQEKAENVYATHCLYRDFPAARKFRDAPAGMISIRITQTPGEYIMWFRPEIITTLEWGGRPEDRKIIEDGRVRLHPLLSFDKYTERKGGEAEPWAQYELDGALALRNDIKEVVLVKYQEMRQVNEQLVSAYDELESFSYTLSHDLRAPLRAIKGFAEILTEDYVDKLDEFGQQALTVIVGNVEKMSLFIDGILEFSRLGSLPVRTQTVDLAGLVKEVWESIREEENAVDLRLELDAATIDVDHTLFWRVFQNLLSNAIKYRRKDVDSYVTVGSRLEREEERDTVVITVADNGIGFDMKYAEQVFAVFNRLVAEEEYEGTGVGLAFVHRIVERHGGSVSAVGELGVGSTFTLRIPAGQPGERDAA